MSAEDAKKLLSKELQRETPDYERIAALSDALVAQDPSAVRFTVDARHIHRLGFELVGKQETALSELIKNAYDADSTRVAIDFNNYSEPGGTLVIVDNGLGMSETQIREAWMRLSTNDKEENPASPIFGRSRAGRKGIGRFAVERLGKRLILETGVRGSSKGVRVRFDWDALYQHGSSLTKIANPIEYFNKDVDKSGTKLIIEGLRDAWTDARFERVWKSVLLLQPPFGTPRRTRVVISDAAVADPGFEVFINGSDGSGLTSKASIEKDFLSQRVARIRGRVSADGTATYSIASEKLAQEVGSGLAW